MSIRDLAQRAAVAASTISRIEAGQVDPGVGTLRAILRATGQELEIRSRRSARIHVADLTDAWSPSPSGPRPDWTRLRAFVDHMTRHRDEVEDAIGSGPEPTGSAPIDALLASVAEKLADDAQLSRPAWTSRRGALPTETFLAPSTPSMRELIRATVPKQFGARNLMIDEGSLWRDRTTVDG